jgi:hypothetical protein
MSSPTGDAIKAALAALSPVQRMNFATTWEEIGKILDVLPVTYTLDSNVLVINNVTNYAHGIVTVPSTAHISLLCVTADFGFTPGEEIFGIPNFYDSGTSRLWQIDADATNFRIILNALSIYRKDGTAAWVEPTYNRWKFRIRYTK